MTTERNKRIILSLRMESNHAPPAFRADVLTTVLERSVNHSFRSVLCSKGNTSNITITLIHKTLNRQQIYDSIRLLYLLKYLLGIFNYIYEIDKQLCTKTFLLFLFIGIQ